MRQKLEKKMFSLEQYAFIDLALKDKSLLEKKTESALAEVYILEGLLPKNKVAAHIVTLRYCEENAVYQMLFDTICRITSLPEKYATLDARILVSTIHSAVCWDWNDIDPTNVEIEGDISYLLSNFKMLATNLRWKKDQLEESSHEKFLLNQKLQYLDDFIDILEVRKIPHPLSSFSQFLLDVWPYAYSDTYAYRSLIAIMKLCEFKNTPERRQETVELIRSLSDTWPDTLV